VQLSVSTLDGKVAVSGEVATQQRRDAVEEVVRRAAGARPVRVDVHLPA
jgi:osmotically-inducible protein OsmY